MTSSVSPKLVHNAWYKGYLCIFGILYLVRVYEGIATVRNPLFQFSLSWRSAKGFTTRGESLPQEVTTGFAILFCTWIFTFPKSIYSLHQ